MNIAIIDDFEEDRQAIFRVVSAYYREHSIDFEISTFTSGEAFLETYRPGKYQLVFLDIYMTGITGMETAEKIRSLQDSCSLIFITQCDSYAVSSYDVQASYYLLKPLDSRKLLRILDTVKISSLRQKSFIEVVSERSAVRVPLASIIYVDTYRNAIQLHTDAGLIRSYLTFQKFEEMIAGQSCFLSCYRGCIVNMDRIQATTEDSFLMDNGESVQMRRRGSNTIKKAYLQYLFSEEENVSL